MTEIQNKKALLLALCWVVYTCSYLGKLGYLCKRYRLPDGTRKKFNVYGKTKAECEKKLAKMIAEKKAEIAKQKKAQKKG